MEDCSNSISYVDQNPQNSVYDPTNVPHFLHPVILKKSSFFRVFAAHAYSRECKNKEYDLTMWNDQLNFFFSKIERERELEILTAILRFPRLPPL